MKACSRHSHSLAFDQRVSEKEQDRAPTPDSACGSEQDWSPPSSSSSTSSSSSSRAGNKQFYPENVYDATPLLKDTRACNSDADSGIVSISHQSRRIWSTSSTDTNQDFVTQKESFPVLSLSVDSQPVLFDDSLHLSEQNVRRSCRKLFANLYTRKDMVHKDVSLSRQPLSVYKNSSNDVQKGQTQPMSIYRQQVFVSSHNSVRRNRSYDNLHSSHSMLSNKSCGHRLSLQHPLCDEVDMLKVYARPVSVIPQISNPHYSVNSKIIVVKDIMTDMDDNDDDHYLTNNRHSLQVLPVPTSTPRLRQSVEKSTSSVSTMSRQPLTPKRTDLNGSVDSDRQPRTLMPPTYSHVHSHTLTNDHDVIDRFSNNNGVLRHSIVCEPSGKEVEYAIVDRSRKINNRTTLATTRDAAHVTSQPCLTVQSDVRQEFAKKTIHKSDFALYKSLDSTSSSASSVSSNPAKKTLINRVQVLGRNAKLALRKAFSTERIYRPQKQELQDEAAAAASIAREQNAVNGSEKKNRGTLIKGIKIRMSKKGSLARKSSTQQTIQALRYESCQNSVWDESNEANGGTKREETWGQLLQLNVDGSQVIELNRPSGKPFGFFVARGRVKDTKGVFVSRMQDDATRRQLAGLLDVGDEILEIEAVDVRAADILEVNTLMAKKRTLLLTVLPYICRKDI